MYLDYNVTDKNKRKKIVNEILEENTDSIKRYFDDYHKTTKDKLSYNYTLEQAANYLLQEDKKKEQNKFENAALPLNDNYFLSKKIKVTPKDIKNIPKIYEIEEFIYYLRQKYKKTEDNKEKRIIRNWIKDLRQNQVLIKESVLRPIGIKPICYCPSCNSNYTIDSVNDFFISESRQLLNLDLFEIDNWKYVLKLLCYFNTLNNNDIIKIQSIYNRISSFCDFNSIERKIIRYYQGTQKFKNYGILTNKDLSIKLKNTQKETSELINDICQKLCAAYEKYFEEEIYYLDLVKGTYQYCKICGKNRIVQRFNYCEDICDDCHKVCSKCGEKKSLYEFGYHPSTKDNRQSWCKKCDAERKF